MERHENVMVVCDTNGRNVPGSWKMCSVCAVEIFLSDSSIRAWEENGFKPEQVLLYCLPCARPKFFHIEEFVPLTSEQLNEINSIVGQK